MHLASVRPRVATAALLASLTLLVAATLTGPGAASGRSPLAAAHDEPSNCTVAYAADDSGAFAGNNEDEVNPLTNIWFVPGEGRAYGSAYVGYDDLVIQGGMNEAGLFFDGLGVREVEVQAQPGKPTYTGENLFVDLLAECDSVACVLERYGALSAPGTWNGQVLFGDRYGDSAIIEPLTVIPKSGSFQVATNFFQSEIPQADRTDQRYVAATSMLSNAESFSVDLMREVMDATHQEGTVNTVYSTVYDLQAAVIHLFYFNDFTTEVTFDLAQELGQGVHDYELSELFPANGPAANLAAAYRARIAAAVDGLSPSPRSADSPPTSRAPTRRSPSPSSSRPPTTGLRCASRGHRGWTSFPCRRTSSRGSPWTAPASCTSSASRSAPTANRRRSRSPRTRPAASSPRARGSRPARSTGGRSRSSWSSPAVLRSSRGGSFAPVVYVVPSPRPPLLPSRRRKATAELETRTCA